ncbi:hypothetical protein KSP40_PGU022403 [Platanthera guangdongensis]|uniref:Uncharacterized protein n=1 Tax=Platanthera guangdongensis TaxID=2320717 RepID=A0ABR2N4J3_9ASPA
MLKRSSPDLAMAWRALCWSSWEKVNREENDTKTELPENGLPPSRPNSPFPRPRPLQTAVRKPTIHLSSSIPFSPSSPLTKLDPPPALQPAEDKPQEAQDKPAAPPFRQAPPPPDGQKIDFYLNVGVAVRTLRDDLPALFSEDYDIYRFDFKTLTILLKTPFDVVFDLMI